MNGAISSLRILPAEADLAALRPATTSEPGFRNVLHSAIDDIQPTGGSGRGQGRRRDHGQRRRRAQRHDRGGKSRSQFPADDAGAQQDRVRLRGNLAHAILRASGRAPSAARNRRPDLRRTSAGNGNGQHHRIRKRRAPPPGTVSSGADPEPAAPAGARGRAGGRDAVDLCGPAGATQVCDLIFRTAPGRSASPGRPSGREKYPAPDLPRWRQPAGARGQARCQPPGNGGRRPAAQRAPGL